MQTDRTVNVEVDQVHENVVQLGDKEQSRQRSVEAESRKRHSEEIDQRSTKKKRYAKQPARLEYRKHLNEMIFEGRRAFREYDPQLEDSQTGLTTWTAVEKEQLFINLARLGRFNISQLSSNLPRKSEAEVKVYLDLLDEASQQFETSTQYVGQMEAYRVSDPEPALEISEECCTALNRNVEILRKILFEEEMAEQDEYFGTYGLLTRSLATDLKILTSNHTEQFSSESHSDKFVPQEQQNLDMDGMDVDERHNEIGKKQNLQSQSGQNGDIPNNHSQQNNQIEEDSSVATIESPQSEMLLSAVRFLDLDALLKLSEVVFMNKGPPNEDENWREISDWDPDGPTMFATAFIDLYKIAVCLTKRVASAAIFQALSRIRAIDHTTKQMTVPIVRQEDVRAALDMLDLKPKQKLHDYWRKKPREYSLQVYSIPKKVNAGDVLSARRQGKASLITPMSYDEVEWRLKPSSRRNPRMEMKDGQFELNFLCSGDNTADSTISVNQTAKATAPAASSSTTAAQPTPFKYRQEGEDNAYEGMTKLEQAWHKYEQAVETEAELMDERESAKHETRLWEIAGKTPPEHIANRLEAISSREDPPHINTKPNGVRPKPWTLALSYRAEWERYGEFLPVSAFRATKKAWIQQKHERERSHLESERLSSSVAPLVLPPAAASSSSSSPSPSPSRSAAEPPSTSRLPSVDQSEDSLDLAEEGLEGDTEAATVTEAKQRRRQQEIEDDEDLESDSGSDIDAIPEMRLDLDSDY